MISYDSVAHNSTIYLGEEIVVNTCNAFNCVVLCYNGMYVIMCNLKSICSHLLFNP